MSSGKKKESDEVLSPASRLLEELKEGKASLSSLLVGLKELAMRLNLEDYVAWIDNETGGYGSHENMPEYREIRTVFVNQNVIMLGRPTVRKMAFKKEVEDTTWYETIRLIQGCGVLEQMAETGFSVEVRPEEHASVRWWVVGQIEPHHIAGVLNAVKKRATDLTLQIVLNRTMEKRTEGIFRDTQEFVRRELTGVSQATLERLDKLLEDAITGKPPNLVALGCRDLLQEFTDALMRPEYLPDGVEPPKKNQTRNKLRYVLGAKLHSGKGTERAMLETQVDALERYFDVLVEYVQKVGHPEGYRSTKEDSKRCVIYTYLIVGDILKLLS